MTNERSADRTRRAPATRPWVQAAAVLTLSLLCIKAFASGGSYATAGTGTYAQSLWWLDFTGYSNATAAAGGQAYSFTLPNGAGTLATTVTFSGTGTLAAVAEPAWTGGALGHGAYDGISGQPILYWLNQAGSWGTVSLTGLTMKDAAGNARTFTLYAADGENTNSGENIVYGSSANWTLIDTVSYYANYDGNLPTLAGAGTATVTETGTNESNYNASFILGTAGPTQTTFALSNNEGVALALSLPTVTLTVSIAARAGTTDQFNASVGYTSPAANLKTVATVGTAATATTGAVSVIGSNSITLAASMASGSASALSYYAGSMACTNSGPGAAAYGRTNTVLPSGAGTSFALTPQTGDNIACTLALTPVTETLTGTVYADLNHNATLDAGETGTGLAGLYVKLAPYTSGSCQNPATAAAAVAAATGAYSFTGVGAGAYCLTLTNSSALTNTSAYLPPGWVGTEAAGGIRELTTSASPSPVQNFGLFNGSAVMLTVFSDTGAGGGTANDGKQNGGELGVNAVSVSAGVAGASVATATTNATGSATLWLPANLAGSVTVTPALPSGYLATGGSAGTTGGTYARPSVTFTYAAGSTYTGLSFGLIPPASLTPNGAQTAQPASIVYYPHTVVAGSAGAVSFATTAIASPSVNGWTQVVYLDSTCSGQFAGTDTEIGAPIALAANQQVCVLVKQFVPAGASSGAENKVTLSASFLYSGAAAPATTMLAATDTTTVVQTGATTFSKQVVNLSAAGTYATSNTALPGNTLQYQLTVTNQGSGPIANVVVNDATPSFTTYLSAACPVSLPAGLTHCSVSTQPAAGGQGALTWTFSGTLAPGAQTAVTYQVVVAQ